MRIAYGSVRGHSPRDASAEHVAFAKSGTATMNPNPQSPIIPIPNL